MKFYKIRHNPTGMFYKPSRYASKANMSKKGKVYNNKPTGTLKILRGGYYHPDDRSLVT